MKIGEFLREKGISVGDNASLLLKEFGLDDDLLRFLESKIGESAKMSKSKGNVVDPEEAIGRFGADAVRLYILFAAPPEQDFEWTDEGIQGAYRFLNRLWNFVLDREELLRKTDYTPEDLRRAEGKAKELRRLVHETVRDYVRDVEKRYQLNTAIAKLMKLLGELSSFTPQDETDRKVLKEGTEVLLLLLSPITPHVCEELWHRIGKESLIVRERLPKVDEEALRVEEVEVPVQVNGKLRARVKVPYGAPEEVVREIVLKDERVRRYVGDREVKRFVYVKNKLVNIVL